ncbi:hypothetical protein Tco_0572917 [Tanacetum coccineum]
MIPYPRFTKLIVSHYMTTFPKFSRRAHDEYHNVEDYVMIKSIFNSRKSKGVVGMKIPNWMITDEIKLTKNYQLYVKVFEVDVPTTQSTVIRLRIPPRRSTRLTPPTLIPKTDEADDLVLQDTLQVSLAKQKSGKEQNVDKVKEHLMAVEIKKLVEGSENVEENVEVASSPLRNDDNQTNLGTRLEPRSDKERPKVQKIVDISQPVNVIKEEEESKKILKVELREKRKRYRELTKTDTIPSSSTPSSSSSKLSATNRLLYLFKSKSGRVKRYKSFFDEIQGKYGYLFGNLTTKFMRRRKFNALARHLQDIMMESFPKMVDERIKKIIQTQVPLHVAQGTILEREKSQAEVAKMIVDAIQQERKNFRSEISSQVNDAITNQIPLQNDPHYDAHPKGENSAKRQKTTEHGTFELGGSSSGQDYESEPGPSTSSNQEQSDDFDFWTNSYATDDDVLSNEKVS